MTSVIVGDWISEARHLPVLTDVTRALMIFHIIGASLQGLFRPFGQRFKVTAKGGNRSAITVQWDMLWKYSLLLGLTLVGIGISQLPQHAVSGDASHAAIVHYWSFMNAVLLLLTAMVCIELPQYRTEERFVTKERAQLAQKGSDDACDLQDISVTGASFRAPGYVLERDECVQIRIAEVDWISAIVTRQIGNDVFAVRFLPNDKQRGKLMTKVYTSGYANRMVSRARPLPLLRAVTARSLGF